MIDGQERGNTDEREGAGRDGGFGAGEAKGDDDGGSDAAVGDKLPAMLAAVEAI